MLTIQAIQPEAWAISTTASSFSALGVNQNGLPQWTSNNPKATWCNLGSGMLLQQNDTFYPMHKDYYNNANNETLLLTCLDPFWPPKHYHLRQRFLLPQHIFEDNMGAIGVPPQVFYCIPSSNGWPNKGCQQSLGSCSSNSLWAQQTMGQLLAHYKT
jgi:hypothetical protein